MNTKFKLLLTAFLCSISSVLIAQSVNINTAKTIAEHYLTNIRQKSLKSAGSSRKSFHINSVRVEFENKDTLYYILNDTINKGFVIVLADKRVWPILAYSTDGSFNEKKQPEAFTTWMDNRKKEIESIKKNNLQPDNATIASWQNLSLKSSAVETKSVEPLILTQWDQGCFYNSLCPADAAGPCGHTYTGCTITAMAQIMKYWNYPTKGTGTHSYSHPNYGNLSADFGSTTYPWSQMPNSVTSQNDAIATLMYHCGVSLDTDYGPNASGADNPRGALVQYFNYSSNAMLVNRNGLTTSEWTNILKSELDLQHPIWYKGDGSVGHAFVCDGYQNADYFHFNWGWGGLSDGYFYIGNLNPFGNNFSENQYALINILPGSLPDGYKGFFLSSKVLSVNEKGGTTSVDICSSTNWTASSNQSWLSLSTNAGNSGKITLVMTATENQTGKDRSAIVTISASGFSDQSITVNEITKVNVTPGGLYNLISKNAISTTKLTLSGTIDARDFKTIRDAMPALTYLDLSDATIVDYTGAEGTVNQSRAYPANEIPANAFFIISCEGQNLLKSVILPSTITSIEWQAFGNSKYLTTINIPASVTNISGLAFDFCSALINVDTINPNYSSIDGVLYDKEQTEILHCPISKTGNLTIPSSVNSIGGCAFSGCSGLTSLTIPLSVISIGGYAFFGCSGLSSIFIPSTVTLIESQAFQGTTLINVDANNLNYSSIDGILFNKTQTKLMQCPTSKEGIYTIPSSVSIIGRYAFSGCSRLTSITIPSSVTTIELCAFSGCSGITNVTIPSSIIAIEYAVFNSCTGLKSIIIPLSVIAIQSSAFSNCSKLSSIFVYFISPVYLNSSPNVFDKADKNTCTLYVPYGSKAAFQAADQWKDFINIVEMPGIFLSGHTLGMGSNAGTAQIAISSSSNWTAISDQTWLSISPSDGTTGSNTISFTASANPAKVVRNATVTISATGTTSQTIEVTQYGKVEVSAGNLKTILAGQLSTVRSLTLTGIIDARDFKTMRDEMSALTDIDLSGVTIAAYTGTAGTCTDNNDYPADGVPDFAFCSQDMEQGKTSLSSIILPASVTSIGYSAFKNCEGLTTINIPPSVTSIGYSAFSYCMRITAINIPSSVTSIGDEAFVNLCGLIKVDTNNLNYSSVDGILFNKTQTELIQFPTSRTGSYIIPSSVTSIGSYAFMYCNGLTNVLISPSVTSIGVGAFCHCLGLTSIVVPLSVTSIGIYAFADCSRLVSVTIPSSIISIESWAFSGCTGLRSIYIYKKPPPSLDNSIDVFSLVNETTCTLYVPYGSKTQYATANQWKDFWNIIEMPGIFLSNYSIGMDSDAGTAQISISSSSNWTATSNQTWLAVTPSVGTGTNSLTFTAQENPNKTARSSTVTVSAAGVESQTITVIQEAKSTTGIDQLSKKSEFIVYPNPTTGKIKLVFDEIPLSGISVIINDIVGKNCLKQLIREKESWIDLSGNVRGIYFIKTDQENFKTQKVILK